MKDLSFNPCNSVLSVADISEILQQVKDPEIPTISLIELGIIDEIKVENKKITISMIPTFAGCPAIDYMKNDVIKKLAENGIKEVDVVILQNKSWSSDRISESGLEAIRIHGLATPKAFQKSEMKATCPKCNSENTELMSPFGPTLCRAIFHCNSCKETFEQFKFL